MHEDLSQTQLCGRAPRLQVRDIQVRTWYGSSRNAQTERLATQVSAAVNPRAAAAVAALGQLLAAVELADDPAMGVDEERYQRAKQAARAALAEALPR